MGEIILQDAEKKVNIRDCKHCQYFYMHIGKPVCMDMPKELEECNIVQLTNKVR